MGSIAFARQAPAGTAPASIDRAVELLFGAGNRARAGCACNHRDASGGQDARCQSQSHEGIFHVASPSIAERARCASPAYTITMCDRSMARSLTSTENAGFQAARKAARGDRIVLNSGELAGLLSSHGSRKFQTDPPDLIPVASSNRHHCCKNRNRSSESGYCANEGTRHDRKLFRLGDIGVHFYPPRDCASPRAATNNL